MLPPLSDIVCTLPIESPQLPLEVFEREYRAAGKPVVIRNATAHAIASEAFRAMTTIPALMESFADANVTLSSANAFSYGRRRLTVAQHLSEALAPSAEEAWATDDDDDAASQYYWFGEHGPELEALTSRYPLPQYAARSATSRTAYALDSNAVASPSARWRPSHPPPPSPPLHDARVPALSFGVGPEGSGVPFHFHADGFSEVLHGAKHWLLYRNKPPRFRENATSATWLRRDYPVLRPDERPLECLIRPGDLLYFPNGWWHAVINRGSPVTFMSTFL